MKRSPHCKMPVAVRQAPLVGSVETLNSGHFHVQVPLLSQCRGLVTLLRTLKRVGRLFPETQWEPEARAQITGSLGSLDRQASTPSRQL